jgi:hypothetical protein
MTIEYLESILDSLSKNLNILTDFLLEFEQDLVRCGYPRVKEMSVREKMTTAHLLLKGMKREKANASGHTNRN